MRNILFYTLLVVFCLYVFVEGLDIDLGFAKIWINPGYEQIKEIADKL